MNNKTKYCKNVMQKEQNNECTTIFNIQHCLFWDSFLHLQMLGLICNIHLSPHETNMSYYNVKSIYLQISYASLA